MPVLPAVVFGQWHGHGVIDARAYPLLFERVHDGAAMGGQSVGENSDHAVIAVGPIGIAGRQNRDAFHRGQFTPESRGIQAALDKELRQLLHLLDADRRRQLVHPVVQAELYHVIDAGHDSLINRAVIAESLDMLDLLHDLGMPAHGHAALSSRQVFDRVEGEESDIAEQTAGHAFVAAADGQRAVFDNRKTPARRQFVDPVHIDRQAEIVHDADGSGPFRQRRFDLLDVDIACRRFAVDEDWLGASDLDGVRRRDMRLCRNDHFIAGADAQAYIGQMQPRRAGAKTGCVSPGSEEAGEVPLELLGTRAVNQLRTRQHFDYGPLLFVSDDGAAERNLP